VENIGSARVMGKAGLVREGLLRRWLIHPNVGDENPATASATPVFDRAVARRPVAACAVGSQRGIPWPVCGDGCALDQSAHP
jgi:hypothetical protein